MQTESITGRHSGPVFVVDGYGASINVVERGHLIIRDGHGPAAARRTTKFSRGRTKLRRLVVRSPGGIISFAAIDWCSRMGVTIAYLNSDSRLLSCYVPDRTSDGPLKRAQAIAGVTDDGVAAAQSLLRRKFKSQIDAIEAELPDLGIIDRADPRRARALREISAIVGSLDKDRELRDLLAHEGYAARTYWELLAGALLPWPGWTKKRIPEHWLRVWPRESGLKTRVRHATDPFNALLNYGYTLLEVEVRIACEQEGLSPDLGLIHVDDRLRQSAIYDLEEPIRTRVDTLSFAFCHREGLRPHMFHELPNGVVRLDPDLARAYAAWLMPQLRQPAAEAAASFARDLRHITIPYRLIDDRKAVKYTGHRLGDGGPCGYCKKPLKKIGLKYCSRHCYLRYSVEVARPIELAQAKLHKMRSEGLSPGHGGEAAKKRGAAVATSNKRRAMRLTPDERRVRRADQQRKLRQRKREAETKILL